MNVTQTSTITSHGNLVLDSTSAGTKPPRGTPPGGRRGCWRGEFLNYGTIETETQAPGDKLANFVQLEATLVNEPHASVRDLSGQLQADAITNYGNFTVAAGASMSLIPLQVNFGGPASFANYGALVNDGSITAYQTAGAVTWTQAGGPIKGNEVVLGGGAILIDKSGAAQFFVDSISAQVKGTIPPGQKITVVGEAYNYRGDNYNGTTLGMDASTVVNDGTIVLEAQGSGIEDRGPGRPQQRCPGELRHHPRRGERPLLACPVRGRAHQQALRHLERHRRRVRGQCAGGGDQRRHGQGRARARSTSSSRRPLSPTRATGRSWRRVSSPKSLGQFQVVSPCCAGPGKFIAGGSLDPDVVGPRRRPTPISRCFCISGGVFKGTFAHLAKPFTADYAHETATPAFVGAVYEESGKKKR